MKDSFEVALFVHVSLVFAEGIGYFDFRLLTCLTCRCRGGRGKKDEDH